MYFQALTRPVGELADPINIRAKERGWRLGEWDRQTRIRKDLNFDWPEGGSWPTADVK